MAIPGASQNKALSALWFVDRNQAIRLVQRALQSTEGSVLRAAKLLKVGRTTLNRWIHDTPELQETIRTFPKSRGRGRPSKDE